ncbi:MAG TPA: DNA internalization-related competence protein ComEC/Rec2 [Candidatus Acidoferrales bacterium]|nr:DNA internalization-related competence protein ComEC/Rec2 [Candidatus Acidoferrales bacterium]
MKAPTLTILVAFSAGIIAVTLHPFPAKAPIVFVALVSSAAFLGAMVLWSARAERWALAAAFLGWMAAGALALTLARESQPADLASRMIEEGRLDASQPLRWRGTLREDLERLPWGMRFEVELEGVSIAGQDLKVTGGLRASYYDFEKTSGAAQSPAATMHAGDRVELLAQARLPRNFKDPGAFDYRAQLARQGIVLTASLRSLQLLHKLPGAPISLRNRLARLRGRLLDRVDLLFGAAPGQAAVLRAMLLGDRSFVDNEIADSFRKTSAYHVLVIAGLHVAALAAFVVWIGERLRARRMGVAFAAIAVLVAYAAIVQDRPPVLRATLMAAAYLVARAFFRRMDTLQVAAVAALMVLIWRPGELADPSFQFSFLAIGAIGGIALPWLDRTAEPLRRALQNIGDSTRDRTHSPGLVQLRLDMRALSAAIARKLPAWLKIRAAGLVTNPIRGGIIIWEAFVISAVLQVGLMPLMTSDFHRVSLLGPFANIGAVLLTGIIVPLGFAALAVSFVSVSAGRVLGHVASAGVAVLLKTVGWFAKFNWANVRVPTPPVWIVVCFFAGAIALAAYVRWQRKRAQIIALCFVVACAIVMAVSPFAPRVEHSEAELTVLDVGQGDSIFLAAPDGRLLLTDGGGGTGPLRFGGMQTRFDIGEEVVSPYLWSRGIKKLDAVALTHAHEDHIEGLYAVLENFRVDELWVGHDVASSAYKRLLETARRRGTRIVHLQQDDSVSWGGMRGSVLWPDTVAEVSQATNDDSLVLRFDFGKESLLLAGDIEKPVERALVAVNAPLEATFLKAPHHGSATSTTEPFLERVHPAFAAISVGENNPFNHPSPAVVERLRAAGTVVYRTDRDGAITFTSDGRSAWVRTYVESVQTRNSFSGNALSRSLPK